MTKTELRAAIAPAVKMPRMRRKNAHCMRLTEVVSRVLVRAYGPGGPFGIFLINGRCMLVGTQTGHFAMLWKKRGPDMIGIYDKNIRIADLIDDLSEHFSDESE